MDFMAFLLTGDIYSPKLVQSEFQTSVYNLREQKITTIYLRNSSERLFSPTVQSLW